MANLCPTPIHICRLRVTRLNADGTVAAAPSNHYVSDKPMMLTVAPDVSAGDSKIIINGCDCAQVTYRGKDKLIRFNLTLQMAALEPGLSEILTGAGILTNPATELIGNSFPIQTNCAGAQNSTAFGQPPSAIEAWQDLWVGDQQNSNPRYVRWIFPMAFFQLDQYQMQNDFSLPQFVGYSRQNSWPNPYVDFPTGVSSIGTQGGWFWDNAVPAAYCGYSSTST